MARNRGDVLDPEVEDTTDTASEGTEAAEKPAKAKKEPKRGELPEGYVTPVGLAKALSEKEGVEIKPQMIYSYIKNAPKDDRLPLEDVTDSVGATRSVVKLDAGLAWWDRKNQRVAARKENAATKKATKEANKAAKAAAGDGEASATEAE